MKLAVIAGDGIGPEIMNATLQILEAAGAAIAVETIEIGLVACVRQLVEYNHLSVVSLTQDVVDKIGTNKTGCTGNK